MKLVIFTQIHENYAWREDGTLATGAEAYWKAKGSDEYVVRRIRNNDEATMAVMALRDKIEQANDAMTEVIVDWRLVSDDYVTEFEKSQLEYEGKITYPAKELSWD